MTNITISNIKNKPHVERRFYKSCYDKSLTIKRKEREKTKAAQEKNEQSHKQELKTEKSEWSTEKGEMLDLININQGTADEVDAIYHIGGKNEARLSQALLRVWDQGERHPYSARGVPRGAAAWEETLQCPPRLNYPHAPWPSE